MLRLFVHSCYEFSTLYQSNASVGHDSAGIIESGEMIYLVKSSVAEMYDPAAVQTNFRSPKEYLDCAIVIADGQAELGHTASGNLGPVP